MKTYRINEIFLSLQGEGRNAGTAAVFVRFSGCNLKCPFCDTDFSNYKDMTAHDIVNAIYNEVGANPLPSLCVITGGEPSLQLTTELVDLLHDTGMSVAVETNGTRELPGNIDFVTISPKTPFTGNADVVLQYADEVKVIMTEKISIEEIRSFEKIEADYYYIQPCDTGYLAPNEKVMQRCVEFVKVHPNWRLSLQQQKILKVR